MKKIKKILLIVTMFTLFSSFSFSNSLSDILKTEYNSNSHQALWADLNDADEYLTLVNREAIRYFNQIVLVMPNAEILNNSFDKLLRSSSEIFIVSLENKSNVSGYLDRDFETIKKLGLDKKIENSKKVTLIIVDPSESDLRKGLTDTYEVSTSENVLFKKYAEKIYLENAEKNVIPYIKKK